MNAAQSLSDRQSNFIVVFTAAYTASVSMFILLLFLPRIASISHKLRQRRMILLLLPTQLIRALPYVRAIVVDVLAESDDAATSLSTIKGKGARRGSSSGGTGIEYAAAKSRRVPTSS